MVLYIYWQVVVIDQEPAVCKARGDPYMSTFDSGR